MHVVATIIGFVCFLLAIKCAWDADDPSPGPFVQFITACAGFGLITIGIALIAWGIG